jgi:hypothetical protein
MLENSDDNPYSAPIGDNKLASSSPVSTSVVIARWSVLIVPVLVATVLYILRAHVFRGRIPPDDEAGIAVFGWLSATIIAGCCYAGCRTCQRPNSPWQIVLVVCLTIAAIPSGLFIAALVSHTVQWVRDGRFAGFW